MTWALARKFTIGKLPPFLVTVAQGDLKMGNLVSLWRDALF